MEDDGTSAEHAPAAEMLPLIYDELRRLAKSRIANESPGQTLQATALVHEAYMRLTNHGGTPRWENKRHFFGAAAQAMRRILIDRARSKNRIKRGGGDVDRVELHESQITAGAPDDDLLAIDEALNQLSEVDPESAELVRLKYFVGLTVPELAELTGNSERTIKRKWAYARAWLRMEIDRDRAEP